MSLFSALRRLYRTDRFLIEDPHTEIVAQVLRNSNGLTLAWLRQLGVTRFEKATIHIDTQESFEKLVGHSSASRPDITIRLSADGGTELVFVESKVPSIQGEDQLQRYADHLAVEREKKGYTKVSLIFITRDYEPAEAPVVTHSLLQPSFYLARWFVFYQHVKAHFNGDGLARELMLLMEENRMSIGSKFRSTDFVALESFISARALMNETLDGEATSETKRIFGGVDTANKIAPRQLQAESRYIIASQTWNTLVCLIGYWLPDATDEPVWVGMMVYCNPKAPARKETIDAFRDWVKKKGDSWSLDDESEWSSIYKGKPLQCFMGEEDHVRSIREFFLELLKEIEAFKGTYTDVLWT